MILDHVLKSDVINGFQTCILQIENTPTLVFWNMNKEAVGNNYNQYMQAIIDLVIEAERVEGGLCSLLE